MNITPFLAIMLNDLHEMGYDWLVTALLYGPGTADLIAGLTRTLSG